uniref:GRAM domain-containing protein n=1 Tax=Denticeps clupeoides TaxID=299321 RepID=A0AAY4CG22_9TELE
MSSDLSVHASIYLYNTSIPDYLSRPRHGSHFFFPSAVYSCALLRDILLQGRLYISRNWLCFYANLFGKDIKVAIPVLSVRLVKKHKTAGLVPNGLAITTDSSQKYIFVSLMSRDSVYDILRRICTHLQVNGKSLSLKQYMEEPNSMSLVRGGSTFIFRKLTNVSFSRRDSRLDCRHDNINRDKNIQHSGSVLWTRGVEQADKVTGTRHTQTGDLNSDTGEHWGNAGIHRHTPPCSHTAGVTGHGPHNLDRRHRERLDPGTREWAWPVFTHLLSLFMLRIILLILSSCYLAFRVCSLEQQLSFLSHNPALPIRDR